MGYEVDGHYSEEERSVDACMAFERRYIPGPPVFSAPRGMMTSAYFLVCCHDNDMTHRMNYLDVQFFD